MPKEIINDVRGVCLLFPEIRLGNYKKDSLNDILKWCGFELFDDSIDGEYMDIKAYYGCPVVAFKVD